MKEESRIEGISIIFDKEQSDIDTQIRELELKKLQLKIDYETKISSVIP